MELRENLELIEVVYKNENKKAILTFLDEENGQVLEINFNKQIYDDNLPGNNKFKDDSDKEKKVEEWCEEYFETNFDNLTSCVGVERNIYVYDGFNSLWESEQIEKFKIENEGEVFTTNIKEIVDDGKGIRIRYEIDEKTHESKMMYSDYNEARRMWFVNPQKQKKQYERFEKKFGVTIENKDEILGKKIMVEVRTAFGSPFGDIKKPNWK